MRKIKNIAIFLSAFVAVLILMDVFLYSSGIFPVNNTEYYNHIGKGLRSNHNYVYFNEGFSMGKTSPYRYYGNVHPIKKKTNVYRIALMGDSYVEGVQVFKRDHFGPLLENKLIDLNFKAEVLNFGRSAFVLRNMYAYQQTFVQKFNPDIYLYFLSESNLKTESSDPSLATMIYDKDSLLSIKLYSTEYYINNYKKANTFLKKSALLYALNNSKRYLNSTHFKKLLKLDSKTSKTKEDTFDEIPKISLDILAQLDKSKTIIVWRDIKNPPQFLLDYLKQNNFDFIDLTETFSLMENNGNPPTYWKVTDKYGHFNQNTHINIAEQLSHYIENKKHP